ncbi:SusE domain-containing protein [Pinibacter aurantiacus]|uniref:SusE domain-containing protein n=1 Tax=Pinibacter aurantiacus TaxID=2851599 RepID=A0A9E2SA49_9BACT|nr:SusE domain-containing protein [Pinibacter aurantiacus]MBV4358407.1 SusE domain-containing protein [Pinibacter aurantiacus]
MKLIYKLLSVVVAALVLFASCKKDEDRSVLTLPKGAATKLTASSTSLVLTEANAKDTVVTFTWPAVNYGYNALATYTLEFSLPADTFKKANKVLVGANVLKQQFSGADFNQIALLLGMTPAVQGTIWARLRSDLKTDKDANSNVPSSFSDTIKITVTPYSTKPVPKYPVPDDLFIVGSATDGEWNNPVPVPNQQFTKLDDNTFGIIVHLTGGQEYVFLPKNGDWGHKYNVTSNTDPALKHGGPFAPDAGDKNIPGPDATGNYKIIVDFVAGTYTVTPFDVSTIPANLFIIGDATAGGWTNPVPAATQQFTKVGLSTFQITVGLTSGGGKGYLLIPVNGSWDHKYAVADGKNAAYKAGGPFTTDSGDNIPPPDESGSYKITVSFVNNTYTVSK